MKKIAVTGNIACGKSLAFDVIKSLNYPIVDCDNIVKDLYDNDEIIGLLKLNFPQIISNDKVNLKKLAQVLFDDKKEKYKFENLIFPFVKEKISYFFELNKNSNFAFVVIPLLFEANMQNLFNKKIIILADDKLRENRLINRHSNLSSLAKKVFLSQMNQYEKAKLCDFVIENNGTIDEFKSAIKEVLNNL